MSHSLEIVKRRMPMFAMLVVMVGTAGATGFNLYRAARNELAVRRFMREFRAEAERPIAD